MNVQKHKLNSTAFLKPLTEIASPPKALYIAGDIERFAGRPVISIVGARAITPYGRGVTARFAGELAQLGFVIVSGLALGTDSIAHHAALEAGGLTVAVLPRSLDKIYPASHHQLAMRIISSGGALISEYEDDTPLMKHNFIARNRLIAGLAQGVLIPEAAEKSGSLHTVRFALDQGKTVMAVPGNITSRVSGGTNNLLKSGAAVITSTQDVLEAMGLETLDLQREVRADSAEEAVILELLQTGTSDGGELLARSRLSAEAFNEALTMLEISGRIRPLGAGQWTVS